MIGMQTGYWYLASYPKSGNTWCRIFIIELLRLASDPECGELSLRRDISTGDIVSSRSWLSDQIGVNSCDLNFEELDALRGRAGESALPFAETYRFHKVHDAFKSPRRRPIVSTAGCHGVVYILRHPEDVVVSLSHFFSWSLEVCIDFLLNPNAALAPDQRSAEIQVRQSLRRWDEHVRSWVDQTELPVLVLRYEDMLAKGPDTFMALASFLGLPMEASLVEQALANTSINRLKKLEEQEGGFPESSPDCNQFFRSGRIGEGAEQLSIEQRQRLNIVLGDVMKRFHYKGI